MTGRGLDLRALASLVFLAAAAVHVALNWGVLLPHVKSRAGVYGRFRREAVIAATGVTAIILLVASDARLLP
jgi:hypothetical protein